MEVVWINFYDRISIISFRDFLNDNHIAHAYWVLVTT